MQIFPLEQRHSFPQGLEVLQRHPRPSPRATLCQKKTALSKVMTALIYYLVAPDSPFNTYSYNDGQKSLSISPLWQTRW